MLLQGLSQLVTISSATARHVLPVLLDLQAVNRTLNLLCIII